MMREIKFRAWVNRYKKYMPVWSITWDSSDNPMLFVVGDTFGKPLTLNASEVIFEQYAGLKDKNGKEIYDGDIIKNTIKIADNKSATYQVFYKQDFAQFDVSPVDGKIDILSGAFNFASMEHYEVIGNIHENKELLERSWE